tara:strand:+ start:46007 stop:47623 length:1617 start_codon:yes stop_codon:yes gene_type:complete
MALNGSFGGLSGASYGNGGGLRRSVNRVPEKPIYSIMFVKSGLEQLEMFNLVANGNGGADVVYVSTGDAKYVIAVVFCIPRANCKPKESIIPFTAEDALTAMMGTGIQGVNMVDGVAEEVYIITYGVGLTASFTTNVPRSKINANTISSHGTKWTYTNGCAKGERSTFLGLGDQEVYTRGYSYVSNKSKETVVCTEVVIETKNMISRAYRNKQDGKMVERMEEIISSSAASLLAFSRLFLMLTSRLSDEPVNIITSEDSINFSGGKFSRFEVHIDDRVYDIQNGHIVLISGYTDGAQYIDPVSEAVLDVANHPKAIVADPAINEIVIVITQTEKSTTPFGPTLIKGNIKPDPNTGTNNVRTTTFPVYANVARKVMSDPDFVARDEITHTIATQVNGLSEEAYENFRLSQTTIHDIIYTASQNPDPESFPDMTPEDVRNEHFSPTYEYSKAKESLVAKFKCLFNYGSVGMSTSNGYKDKGSTEEKNKTSINTSVTYVEVIGTPTLHIGVPSNSYDGVKLDDVLEDEDVTAEDLAAFDDL